jgi:tRNA(adenine34) deaminase
MDDQELMGLALEEARLAEAHGDVPVGAVVVLDGVVIARAHNEREHRGDPTAHAEVLALRAAAVAVGSSRLDNATLVSTLEPCPMCAGAALMARVGRVVFGAEDPKAGCLGTLYNLGADPRLNHEFAVRSRVRADECGALLQDFFASKR